MQLTAVSPRPLATERSPWLRGTLRVPGDAALTHLALACGAMSRRWSGLDAPLDTGATRAFAAALEALGARVVTDEGRWHVCGPGVGGFLEPVGDILFAGSPYGLQLVAGLAGTSGFLTRIEGINPQLAACRLEGLLAGLDRFGVDTVHAENGRLPVTLRGPAVGLPAPIALPGGDPATKAALLIAALAVPGISVITEGRATANHPERMLARFGADIDIGQEDGARRTSIRGLTELDAQEIDIPADTGLAALGALAASIVSGSDLRIESVLVNPARTAILSALVAMGARIEVQSLRRVGGEEIADLAVRHGGLRGIALAADYVAPLLDDLPVLAVAAALAEGDSTLNLPPGLPLETHGRIAALVRGLAANGVDCDGDEDRLAIRGAGGARGRVAGGGRVLTAGDPDLGLAFLVLGMAADDQVTISDQSGIEERFPGFLDGFEGVGASFVRYSD